MIGVVIIFSLIISGLTQAATLILFLSIILLPGVLIILTGKPISLIFWMLIYIMAIPIWNFILPLYAFWHFDDFSWGATRKVESKIEILVDDISGKTEYQIGAVKLKKFLFTY